MSKRANQIKTVRWIQEGLFAGWSVVRWVREEST